MWCMAKVLSNKFAKKVIIVKDIAELERYLPMGQVFVPPAISGYVPSASSV